MQMSMATIVTSRMKILRKSLNFRRFCLDFGFSAVIPKKLVHVLIEKLDSEILFDVFQLIY